MSSFNQVIWSEGMFLRPQHLQQQTRYVESLVERRCGPLRSFAWGFSELKLDQALLASGKLAIEAARGVFPDGTPFDIPNDAPPPPPLDISDDIRDTVVCLALPLRQPGTVEVHHGSGDEGLARTQVREYDVRDTAMRSTTPATLQVGALRTRLLLPRDGLADYACLGVCHVVEARPDRQVVLKDDYIAPVLQCSASRLLTGFINEVHALLHHRGEALSGRVSASGRGGAAEISDFLMLQTVNRYEPLMAHLAALGTLHPEQLYATMVEMAGEFATFTSSSRRAPAFEAYRHDDLRATFRPVTEALFESLRMVLEQSAVSIELKERKFGVWAAAINDRSLVTDASLVLAVAADTPTEELRRHFPAQVKVGPVEKIRDLVNLQLPGIPLQPLPVAPRQIPYHTGFVYFEADRSGDYWKQLANSAGIAIHVGGQHENLQMELWAIRRS